MGRVVNTLIAMGMGNCIHTANRVSSLPPNGSLFRFFLGEKMGRVGFFLGSAQDIGGKEGTEWFQYMRHGEPNCRT